MAIVVNQESILLREPNLLVPGKKPVGAVKLNPESVIKDSMWRVDMQHTNLVYAGYPEFRLDSAFIDNNTSYVGSPYGRGLKLSGASSYTVFSDTHIRDNLSRQNFTYYAHFIWSGFNYSQSNFLFGNVQRTGTGYNWGVYVGSSGDIVCFVKVSSTAKSSNANTPVESGKRYMVVCTYDGANVITYCNGKKGTPTSQTGSVNVDDFDMPINYWNNYTSLNCIVLSCGVINKALSEGEAISFSKDPYCIYVPA